jgi:hypothetical protein
MFKGLECYAHDYCIGNACKDILNTSKTCENKDAKCWVSISKVYFS